MGGESPQVTPTSHAFSGGNVVLGTAPGKAGSVLKTTVGDIPVYSNVREGLDAGHHFNFDVVYLPPSGMRDGVAELIRVNHGLEKIVIITEKIALHDARAKAAVIYVELGSYYEHGLDFGKPVVACEFGCWKSKLTRAVEHAGAMAGTGDKAEDKENWFIAAVGVAGLDMPQNPVASKKGAVATNIADIPAALTAVMKLNAETPEFRRPGACR